VSPLPSAFIVMTSVPRFTSVSLRPSGDQSMVSLTNGNGMRARVVPSRFKMLNCSPHMVGNPEQTLTVVAIVPPSGEKASQ
jgi:hypothetical protein